MQSLIGTGVALVTPFKKDFSVDIEALIRIVNYQIENGIRLSRSSWYYSRKCYFISGRKRIGNSNSNLNK
jgi:predicted aldo/keto reductase-like oxidoreductase